MLEQFNLGDRQVKKSDRETGGGSASDEPPLPTRRAAANKKLIPMPTSGGEERLAVLRPAPGRRCNCCQKRHASPGEQVLCLDCEKLEAMIADLRLRHQEHHDAMTELWAMYALADAGAPAEFIHGMTVEELPRSAGDMWRRLKRWAPR